MSSKATTLSVNDGSESEEAYSNSNSSNSLGKPKSKPNFGDVGEDYVGHGDAAHFNTFLQREAKRVARNPCTYMCTSVLFTIVLSVVGFVVGEFAIEVENEGWWSRGTLQSDRQRQANLVNNQRFNLAYNQSAWDIWMDPKEKHASYESMLYGAPTIPDAMKEAMGMDVAPDDDDLEPDFRTRSRKLSSMHTLLQQAVDDNDERRRLDETVNALAGCDLGFYSDLSGINLWPLWQIPKKEYESTETRTVLDTDVLEAICVAETNTQKYLEENGHCETEARGCDSGKCMPPYSIVLYSRLLVEGGLDMASDGEFAMDCKGLSEAWTPELQEYVKDSWIEEIKMLKILLTPGLGDGEKEEPKYPYGYYPALVQNDFDTNGGRSRYSSSIFDTGSVSRAEILYEEVDNFDRATDSDVVVGAYDTGFEEMNELMVDSLLTKDMTLALASAVIISIAIMVHTQSPLVTGLGLLQIILSFPMAYFFYNLILGLTYFPFLNFIGVFVVFALGAGDIFVAFDKWTNARKYNMTKSTEYVAAVALPDALGAMFLTTLTTAIAFFATAVCPVSPIKMFAIFCGLLIFFDYILTVCFVFPALCIYDKALIKRAESGNTGSSLWLGCIGCGTCFACCSHTHVYDDVVVAAHGSHKPKAATVAVTEEQESPEESESYNAAQRFMLSLSEYLHSARWPLLAICTLSFVVCIYYAQQLELPESSEVRLLKPGIQFEQAYAWRKELLTTELDNLSGSRNSLIWGLDPADTGRQNDPYDGTSLVLDETFDPSSTEAQVYLKDFCDNLYENEFARVPNESYVCPINKFDKWLKDMHLSDEKDALYDATCGSPDGIPMDSDKFHACMTGWALKTENYDVLSRDGIVKYMKVTFINVGVFTDAYVILQEQYDYIQAWLDEVNEVAPEGVNQSFFTGTTFHWHDTNGSIQSTAYESVGIALLASALIILFSSRSVILTVFSTVTILFILASVTSLLVALGWTLGFLEAICFSILIGVSVDFVIHFNHAYVHHKGELSREERTKYAMITMGPSILATAATTFFSAIVMLFCVITFFRKFAQVLFFTIIMATFASFVFFITLTNCFGPSNPTYLVDKCIAAVVGSDDSTKDKGADGDTRYLTAAKVTSLDE